MKLSPAQRDLLWRLAHGCTLHYQPKRARNFSRGFWFVSLPVHGCQDVSARVAHALEDKGLVRKDAEQANRYYGPWTYSLTDEGHKHA